MARWLIKQGRKFIFMGGFHQNLPENSDFQLSSPIIKSTLFKDIGKRKKGGAIPVTGRGDP
jgi:hypothetical protein